MRYFARLELAKINGMRRDCVAKAAIVRYVRPQHRRNPATNIQYQVSSITRTPALCLPRLVGPAGAGSYWGGMLPL